MKALYETSKNDCQVKQAELDVALARLRDSETMAKYHEQVKKT